MRMIKTAAVNIQETVARFCAKADTMQVSTLINEAIAKRMTAFSLPLYCCSWVRILSPNVIKAVWKESEKGIILLLDILKTSLWRCANDRTNLLDD